MQPARLLEVQVSKGAGHSQTTSRAKSPGLQYHPPALAELNAAPDLADTLRLGWQVGLVVFSHPDSLPCSAQHGPAVSAVRCVQHLTCTACTHDPSKDCSGVPAMHKQTPALSSL